MRRCGKFSRRGRNEAYVRCLQRGKSEQGLGFSQALKAETEVLFFVYYFWFVVPVIRVIINRRLSLFLFAVSKG